MRVKQKMKKGTPESIFRDNMNKLMHAHGLYAIVGKKSFARRFLTSGENKMNHDMEVFLRAAYRQVRRGFEYKEAAGAVGEPRLRGVQEAYEAERTFVRDTMVRETGHTPSVQWMRGLISWSYLELDGFLTAVGAGPRYELQVTTTKPIELVFLAHSTNNDGMRLAQTSFVRKMLRDCMQPFERFRDVEYSTTRTTRCDQAALARAAFSVLLLSAFMDVDKEDSADDGGSKDDGGSADDGSDAPNIDDPTVVVDVATFVINTFCKAVVNDVLTTGGANIRCNPNVRLTIGRDGAV
jgi:hypothetical protein